MRKTALIELVCVFLLVLLGFGITGNFTPQAFAAPSGHTYLNEIGTFKDLHAVDVDSAGRVFVRINNTVWRSTDNGASFSKVLDTGDTDAGSSPFLLRVDGNGKVYVNIYNSTDSNFDVYRSTDNGDNWQKVLEDTPRLWRLSEMSNGTLLINTYDTPDDDLIYKSDDGGANWTVWQNLTGQVTDHIHFVRVNPNNDDIWIGCGDQTGAPLGYHNGTDWIWVFNMSSDRTFTDVVFDDTHAYLMPDRSTKRIFKMPYRGSWTDRVNVFHMDDDDPKSGSQGIGYSMMAARYNDGVIIVPTDKETVYASHDGERWVKIVEKPYTGSGAWRFACISQRRPIYFIDMYTDKLYRLDVQKEDIVNLFYREWLSEKGSVSNQATYTSQFVISNGTNHIDLTNVALTNVNATIIGYSKTNEVTSNSGFEMGDETGWSFENDGTHAHGVTSAEAYSGSYSLNINKTGATSGYLYVIPPNCDDVTFVSSEAWMISAYVKLNCSEDNSVRFYMGFTRWDDDFEEFLDIKFDGFFGDTSWRRYTVTKGGMSSDSSPDIYPKVAIKISNYQATNFEMYIDNVVVTKVSDNGDRIIKGVANGDTIVFKTPSDPSYFTGTVNTTNPTLTINSQTFSHPGELTNGTESSSTSLYGILTGAIEVNANIQGSEQAILKINGTRVLYEDSIILQGRTNNVYYGRYYGTFSPTTSTADLIAVTNLASNITSLTHASAKLTLTINSPTGTTSTTKVYCGILGKPIAIYAANGTLTWSYNSLTTVLTLNATHASTTRTLAYWRFPGDVDDDEDVDVFDLFDLGKAYGSQLGDASWNSDCDFNGDYKVNDSELIDLSKDYGKTNP